MYGCNIFRGKDHLYFQNAQKDEGKVKSLENQVPTTNRSQNSQTAGNPSSREPCGQTTNDILSGWLQHYYTLDELNYKWMNLTVSEQISDIFFHLSYFRAWKQA